MNIAWIGLIVVVMASAVFAQNTPSTSPVRAELDPMTALQVMRDDAIDAYNKGDLPRLLRHLDDDAVVTWQNGEVCRGPKEVQAYYDKMMNGPDKRVKGATADPKVIGRHVYGDWAVSWGNMNDHFTLSDGSDLAFNSQFTATTARRGDVWKLTSFHVSTNTFDNAVLKVAVKKTAIYIGLGAALAGLVVGTLLGRLSKSSTPHSRVEPRTK